MWWITVNIAFTDCHIKNSKKRINECWNWFEKGNPYKITNMEMPYTSTADINFVKCREDKCALVFPKNREFSR